jgi:hypothetical protein
MNNPELTTGDTIRIVKVVSKTYEWMEGAEFVLISPTTNQCVQVPGQGWIYCAEWEKVEPIHRYAMPDSTADMATELAQLRIDLATAIRDRDLMHKQRTMMQSDFDKINSALSQEAEDRDWCEDYARFVSNLNTRLSMFQFEMPTIEYEVTVQRTRTVYEQVTVIIEGNRGSSESDLHELACDEACNAYDWHEVDDDVSDFEIMGMEEV